MLKKVSKTTLLAEIVALVLIVSIFVIPQAYAQETEDPFKEPLNKNSKSAESMSAANEKQVIILYKHDLTDKDVDDLVKLSKKIKTKFKIIPAVAAYVDEKDIPAIKSNKNVIDVFEDAEVHAFLSQSVPQIRANQVHPLGINGAGSKVCIVDTGVDDSHPALNPLVAEYDFVNSDFDATDDEGHGTHVAGIVASTDSTYRGVAYGTSLMAAKVLDATGSGFTSDVISGIEWCETNGADIISLSLGGRLYRNACDSDPMAMAGNNAVDQGVVVLAATGNDGSLSRIATPACGSKVIAVGAVNKSDGRTPYSNEGSQLDVVAPGTNIVSTKLGGGFVALTGTSMATPHASGVAALILQGNPLLAPSQVRTILRDTAVDLGASGFDTIFGYGRIDAYAAYISVNDNPTAQDDAYSVDNGSVLNIDAVGGVLTNDSDPDGNPLSAVLVSGVSHGTLSLNSDGSFTYTHDGSLTTSDSFTYNANDGIASSNLATVTITINPVNNIPTANAGPDQTVNEQTTVILDGSGSSDPNGDPLTFSWQQLNQIPQGDIARLLFEDNVLDGTGGNDGTVTGTTTYVTGKPGLGQAFSFSSSRNTHISLAGESDFDFQNNQAFSISAWFKTSYLSTGTAIVAKTSGALHSTGYYIFVGGGSGRLFGSINDGTAPRLDVSTSGSVADGNWHHVVMTKSSSTNGGGLKLYVDNALVSTGSAANVLESSILNDNEVKIGGAGTGTSNRFNGEIDNVRIYNTELTSSDIQALFTEEAVSLSDPAASQPTFTAPIVANGQTKTLTFELTVTDPNSNSNADTVVVTILPVNDSPFAQGNIAELLFENNLMDTSTSGGNDGTVTGTTIYVDGKPGLGQAFSFSSARNTHISLAGESDFDFENNQPFSISAWFKTSYLSTSTAIVAKSSGALHSTGYYIFVGSTAGRLYASINDGSLPRLEVSTAGSVADGNWHHVVMTKSGSTNGAGLKLYVDGALISTGNGLSVLESSILNANAVKIGGAGSGTSNRFYGEIDNVRIYDTELTASEVQALFGEAT